MKYLHRTSLFGWSSFDPARNIDFSSVLWVRKEGNVLIDPLPLTEHDRQHLISLGGASLIVITNSDHIRAGEELKAVLGAEIAGPRGERDDFPIVCDRWLGQGEEVVPGLAVLEMSGSKTPGELALLLEERTLITGDLIRAHRAGSLMLLPDDKLLDKPRAVESVRMVLAHRSIDAVLVGDGWSIFRDGYERLRELADRS